MTPEELQAQLTLTGIVCEVRRGEVYVETCWFCANTRWNLQLDPAHGRFNCWACNAGKDERLDHVLQERLGGAIYLPTSRRGPQSNTATPQHVIAFNHLSADKVPIAARFLSRRGIATHVAKQYGLVVCTEPNHRLAHRLVLPVSDFWTGQLVGHLGRTFTNQYPKYLSTLQTRIAAGYRVRSWRTACVLVEGFFDGIAVHRAGYHAAVLSGTTAPWVPEFGARLPAETPLVVMLDGEATDEAYRLSWSLQMVRSSVHIACLPKGRDPADFAPLVLNRFISKTLA
ncbi:hypothetical protein LCGC14_2280440 [marine sediment metagenome]|uniref:Uncharacterized protein n=1 Tax=marine sediment metagenome TaxID=412755 RepID=A0A0F9CU83_9ZZZZ